MKKEAPSHAQGLAAIPQILCNIYVNYIILWYVKSLRSLYFSTWTVDVLSCLFITEIIVTKNMLTTYTSAV
jgi:hypothetical protein